MIKNYEYCKKCKIKINNFGLGNPLNWCIGCYFLFQVPIAIKETQKQYKDENKRQRVILRQLSLVTHLLQINIENEKRGII